LEQCGLRTAADGTRRDLRRVVPQAAPGWIGGSRFPAGASAMTGPLRIALAQFDFAVGAVAPHAERIAAMIVQARDLQRADVVLFPELAVSGYPPEDLLARPQFLLDCESALQQVAASVTGIVAMVGWPQSEIGRAHV